MASVSVGGAAFSVRAYAGDAKTLLAFNLSKTATKNLAGFTVQVQPQGHPAYFLYNSLQFRTPSDHAQDTNEPAYPRSTHRCTNSAGCTCRARRTRA